MENIIKALPQVPGVYLMKDFQGCILYVGKAKNLKSRVRQYFHKSSSHSPKVEKMVRSIRAIDYITTDTELDALLLECDLIKQIKPMYNKLMKNDLSYPYIKITCQEDFPRLFAALNKEEEDGALYLGPYTSIHKLEEALKYVKNRFKLMNCSTTSSSTSSSGCLNYSLGNCVGVCRGEISSSAYKAKINEVLEFLRGKDKALLSKVEQLMKTASNNLEFEKAAYYRDELSRMKYLLGRQHVINEALRKTNILAAEATHNDSIKLFSFKGNLLLHSESAVPVLPFGDNIRVVLQKLVRSFHEANQAPQGLSLSKQDVDESMIIYGYLKSNKKSLAYVPISPTLLKTGREDKLKLVIDDFTMKCLALRK